MVSVVTRSAQSVSFSDKEKWGLRLMLLYARQLDKAEVVKSELLSTMKQYDEEGGTANVKWWQRIERIEKYMQAEATVNKTGPLLLNLMKEFGMTPVLARPAVGQNETKDGVKGDDPVTQPQVEEVVDELAALREERGKHTRSG
jgi:hypothetical protein